jgi:hypothetical protein
MIQIIRTCRYEHIEKFVVYGERHCGTKFLTDCLSSFDIQKTNFFGHKHWFGYASKNKIKYEMHTLFVCIVRNPYQWIAALNHLQHHIPKENKPYKSLLTNEWYSVTPENKEIIHDRNFLTNNQRKYKNIFELRETKLYYLFNTLSFLARNYVFLTYENFTSNHDHIMSLIESKFNLQSTKRPPTPHEPVQRHLPPDIKSIIDNNINWNIENQIGYFKTE